MGELGKDWLRALTFVTRVAHTGRLLLWPLSEKGSRVGGPCTPLTRFLLHGATLVLFNTNGPIMQLVCSLDCRWRACCAWSRRLTMLKARARQHWCTRTRLRCLLAWSTSFQRLRPQPVYSPVVVQALFR
jgi:hypothetical protein